MCPDTSAIEFGKDENSKQGNLIHTKKVSEIEGIDLPTNSPVFMKISKT